MAILALWLHIHEEVKESGISQEFHNTITSTALELYMILKYELNLH